MQAKEPLPLSLNLPLPSCGPACLGCPGLSSAALLPSSCSPRFCWEFSGRRLRGLGYAGLSINDERYSFIAGICPNIKISICCITESG